MKKYHGSIGIKSNFKSDRYYCTVEAENLEEAKKKSAMEFLKKQTKPTIITDIRLEEIE